MRKKHLLGAFGSLCTACALLSSAWAATYSVTLTGVEASGEVSAALNIPAQTPAAVGAEPDVIIVSAPVANAAVEIPISGSAKDAEVFLVQDGGAYAPLEAIAQSSSVVALLPEQTNTLIVLKKLPFTDTKSSAWYYGAAAYAHHNGLMSGTGKKTFSPNTAVSRSMIAAILWRQAGQPAPAGTVSFADVPAGQFYTDAALWCAEQGILTGSGDKFVPNGKVTREQLAVILYRYSAVQGQDTTGRADLSTFSDSAKVNASAKDAMAWAVNAGIITGSGKKELTPAGTVSRAQLATVLMRYLG